MKNLFLIVIFILFSVQLFAQKERKFIRKGNEYFNSAYSDSTKKDTADFSKAEVSYRKAIEKKPESFDAAFNLGDALYKQKKFKEASNQFQTLASNQKDKQKLAQTYHNLGNSLLQSNKLEESIEAYKNSLRSNPEDMATKYNLAFAQDKLKKQKQQQKNKKQNKQNKDQKDNKDKKNKDKKNQDKNKQDKQQQQQKQDQQKQNQKKQQANQNKISKEDAKRLLEAIQNDEKQVQKRLKKEKAKKSKKVNIEKDW